MNKFFSKAEIGKLIVSGVLFCVEPTTGAATLLSLDGAIEARNRFFKDRRDLEALADDLEKEFTKQLKTQAYDKPEDARQVLPDMLKAALSQSSAFVKKDLDAGEIMKEIIRIFDRQPKGEDCRRQDMQSAFKKLYGPLLQKACNDPRLKAALDPALYRDQRRESRETSENVKKILANTESASDQQLREAANFFQDAPDQGATSFELMTFLKDKAEDHERLSAERAALPQTPERLANLSAQVTQLIDNLELKAAEDLLDSARDVLKQENLRPVLEANAALDAQKADILMLRGALSEAKDLLTAVAKSFDMLEPDETTRRLLKYEDRFYAHGLRYGGDGLALSLAMINEAISDRLFERNPSLWAACQDARAASLSLLGTRSGGADGNLFLAEAVDSYRAALRTTTEEDHPLQWAMTQQNLGTALATQGERTQGPDGAALLAKAVDSYRAALRVRTEEDHPLQWAMTQQNLGTALQTQGERTQGPDGAALLAEVVDSYRAALRVRTEKDHPLQWAMTQQNLGNALASQGERTQGPEGDALLAEAAQSYRAALRVRTEQDHPVHWATTQQNLGNALSTQGERTLGPEGDTLLAEAAQSYRAALRVTTEQDHPVHWARTQQNLAIALRIQGSRTQGPEGDALLAEAAQSYRAALRVRTEQDHPLDWAMTLQNLGNALQTQGSRTQGPEGDALLAEAAQSYRAALRVRTEQDHPLGWAMTMQNLGIALKTQGERTQGPDGAALLAEAVDSYRAALRVRTEEDHPVQWAMTHENLAILEAARAQHDSTVNPRAHLQAALTHVTQALRVYDPVHMSYDYGTATKLRDGIQAALDTLDAAEG